LGFAWILPSLVLALCVGIATPICASICCIGTIYLLLMTGGMAKFCLSIAALVAFAVALLGPGAYSVDARLFGRTRVVFRNRADRGRDET
jgi:hypothetical protein